MTKISKPEYLAKVKLLSKEETERLLSRMGGKLDRRLEKNKLSRDDALAIQLQLEDEQLQEWRKMMHILKKKEEAKKDKEKDKEEKARSPSKAKAPAKSRAPSKAKTPAKTKTSSKANTTAKNKVKPAK
jgi:hypothetical protein